MAAGIPNPTGPDKLLFCPCKMVWLEHTGTAGRVRCTECKKAMNIAAEFPKGTWKK